MNNDPIQEISWKSMGEQWREATPMSSVPNEDVLTEVRRTAKRLLGLTISAGSGAIAVVASLTTLALCHRGILTWTFAIIGWSLFLPFVAFLVFHRRDIIADTQPTSTMIETLLRKQQATKNLLEFLYVLLSVETVLASSFWLVAEWHTHPLRTWSGFAAIFISGTVLVVLFRWQSRQAETRLRYVAGLGRALNDHD
jgi:hypothetical protein